MQILGSHFTPDGPGAALAVSADGKNPLVECSGFADVENQTAITTDTPFELASASKWFTATAVMLLVERKELELRTPVDECLPQLERDNAHRPITIQDLLWHTSGLVDYLQAGVYTQPEEMTTSYVMAQLPQWASAATPGREHNYSNTNYVVLARVVESVVDLSFSDFIEINLIKPFGLQSTAIGAPGQAMSCGTRGYRNIGYGLPVFEWVSNPPIDTDGDGGVVSSLNDLLQWQSLFWGGHILTERSVRLMRTPGKLDAGENFPYGIGLQIEGHGSTHCWCGHGGSWTNTTVLVGRYPDLKVTVIVLSNEWMAPVERICQRAFAMSYGFNSPSGKSAKINPQPAAS